MMHGDGYWDMGGWFGIGHGLFGILIWLVIILVIAALVKYLAKRG